MSLIGFGMFVFTLETAPIVGRSEKKSWRYGEQERVGARPAVQYLGPGADDIALDGSLIPGLGGRFSSIDTLQAMADAGEAYPLVDGDGRVYGRYRIESIDTKKSAFLGNGQPRRIDFSIQLKRV